MPLLIKKRNYEKYRLGGVNKQERIELRKKTVGSRLDRKLKKYSDSFNEIFNFFLNSYRKGLLNFGGSSVIIEFDINGPEGKNTFRKFDNGQFKDKIITSKHPNIVKGVIVAKKSWGLHIKMWSEGIIDGDFTQKEIIRDFENKGIKIPESLLNDFDNTIQQKLIQKHVK